MTAPITLESDPTVQWIIEQFSFMLSQIADGQQGVGKNKLLQRAKMIKPSIYSPEILSEVVTKMFKTWDGGHCTLKPGIARLAKEAEKKKKRPSNESKPGVSSSSASFSSKKPEERKQQSNGPKTATALSSSSSTNAVRHPPPPARTPAPVPATPSAAVPLTPRLTSDMKPKTPAQKAAETEKANESRTALVKNMRMNHVDLWNNLEQLSINGTSDGNVSPTTAKILLFTGKRDADGDTKDYELRRAIANAPLFSENILSLAYLMENGEKLLPQFAVLGITEVPTQNGWDENVKEEQMPTQNGWDENAKEEQMPTQNGWDENAKEEQMPTQNGWDQNDKEEQIVYLNTNVPFSTFICGLQGGGKSHTLSVLLENSMIPEPLTGLLIKPLPAIVFHYSQFTSSSSFRPCEAAYLAKPSTDPNLPLGHKTVKSVRVYVSSSNHHHLKELYTGMADVSVSPLRFSSKDLTIGAMLQLMNFSEGSETPLYMAVVSKILRDLATDDAGKFNYRKFKDRLNNTDLLDRQVLPLKMRLDLLESFLADESEESNMGNLFEAEKGVLHIVDLSCPFVDAETASTLFNICLDSFVGGAGKVNGFVVALDEAHKYLTSKPAATRLTESLLSLVRQQRHYGARVIISTQEPTVSPTLLDLCNVIVMHRFTSREWFSIIKRHLSLGTSNNGEGEEEAYNRIQDLGVGEALVFAPTAMLQKPQGKETAVVRNTTFKMKMRKRITFDGGKSVMAV